MTTYCVLLDDYQGVATTFADWSTLDNVEPTSVREHLPDEDAVVAAGADAEIVVLMRERTPFPASLLARLPHLRLLVTTGMRNASVDVAAATRLGMRRSAYPACQAAMFAADGGLPRTAGAERGALTDEVAFLPAAAS